MKEIIHTVKVEFGDCDPARIVWFPNFFRWIDAASRHFFVECGVPPWHETERTIGIIGTPLVDTHAKFMKTASYGDVLQIHTSIAQWRGKSFVKRCYRGLSQPMSTKQAASQCVAPGNGPGKINSKLRMRSSCHRSGCA